MKNYVVPKEVQRKRNAKAAKVLMKEKNRNMALIKEMTDQDSSHRTPVNFPRLLKSAKKDISNVEKTPKYKREKKLGEAHVARRKAGVKQQKSVKILKAAFQKEMDRQKRK